VAERPAWLLSAVTPAWEPSEPPGALPLFPKAKDPKVWTHATDAEEMAPESDDAERKRRRSDQTRVFALRQGQPKTCLQG
jgi:hypothetical protein